MAANFARRLFLTILGLCMVYNLLLVSFLSTETYKAVGTGSKRLFYAFRPPPTPHQVVPLPADHVAIFIGDIHGCLDELKQLLKLLGQELPKGQDFVLFFLGDLVNKGPHSSKTVKFVRRLVTAGKAHVVRGNHDEAMLEEVNSATALRRFVRFFWPYGKYHYIKVKQVFK